MLNEIISSRQWVMGLESMQQYSCKTLTMIIWYRLNKLVECNIEQRYWVEPYENPPTTSKHQPVYVVLSLVGQGFHNWIDRSFILRRKKKRWNISAFTCWCSQHYANLAGSLPVEKFRIDQSGHFPLLRQQMLDSNFLQGASGHEMKMNTRACFLWYTCRVPIVPTITKVRTIPDSMAWFL